MAVTTTTRKKAERHLSPGPRRPVEPAVVRGYRDHLSQVQLPAANDREIASQRDADDQLVMRAQDGDSPAFELLVRKYQHKTIQLVSRLVGEADAPDVAQEAFIKAWRALPGFRGQSAFYTWLYRIAINSAKNHLVSRARRPATQDIDIADAELYGHAEYLSDLDTPESCLLAGEIRDKVSALIGKLPGDLRQAIVLRELEGLSYEEIAAVMDCPIGTVRSRIFRARESIDAVVQPLLVA
jgi:RNA polymerase sigma-70 factor (ECF subfamily)